MVIFSFWFPSSGLGTHFNAKLLLCSETGSSRGQAGSRPAELGTKGTFPSGILGTRETIAKIFGQKFIKSQDHKIQRGFFNSFAIFEHLISELNAFYIQNISTNSETIPISYFHGKF